MSKFKRDIYMSRRTKRILGAIILLPFLLLIIICNIGTSEEEENKTEVKQSKFEGFTYDEEVALDKTLSNIITLGEEYKQTRKEYFKNDTSVTAKVVYEYEDDIGIIHKYDRCIVFDLNYNILNDGISETKELSWSLVADMKRTFEDVVKNNLTCPSTAKFNGGWFSGDDYQYGFDDNGYPIIIGYVDSENGFGAMVRNYFIGTYKYDEGIMTIDYYN